MMQKIRLLGLTICLSGCAPLNTVTWFKPTPAQVQQTSAMKFETCIDCHLPTPKTLAYEQPASPKVSVQVSPPREPKEPVLAIEAPVKLKMETTLSRDIRFVWGSSNLGPSGKYVLMEIAHQYKPMQSIKLRGAVDETGDPQVNMNLALARANSAAAFLVAKKIPVDKILVTATTSEFEADNATDEGRARNRRVTVEVLSPAKKP